MKNRIKITVRDQRYYFDIRGTKTILICFSIGLILMATPLITGEEWQRLLYYLAIALVLLVIIWVGMSKGSYITINKNEEIYGTLMFFKGPRTQLKKVVSIESEKTLAGLLTELYLVYTDNNGNIARRSFSSKEAIRKEVLRELIESMLSANPKIKIPSELA